MHGFILLLLPIRKLAFIRYEPNFASMVKIVVFVAKQIVLSVVVFFLNGLAGKTENPYLW